jgi:predicted signal transduction protein with EAL and GGDEF domain
VTAAVAAAAVRGEVAWLRVALTVACAGVLCQRQVQLELELELELDALRRDALSDPLTGVANRRSLLARADYEIARHRRAQQSFALVMLDLDGFRRSTTAAELIHAADQRLLDAKRRRPGRAQRAAA